MASTCSDFGDTLCIYLDHHIISMLNHLIISMSKTKFLLWKNQIESIYIHIYTFVNSMKNVKFKTWLPTNSFNNLTTRLKITRNRLKRGWGMDPNSFNLENRKYVTKRIHWWSGE